MKNTIIRVLKNKFFWFILIAYFVGTAHGTTKTVEVPVEKRVEVPVEKVVYTTENIESWKSLRATDDRLLGLCADYIGSSSKVFTSTSEYITDDITIAAFTKVVEREAGNMNNYNDQIETLVDQRASILKELEQ